MQKFISVHGAREHNLKNISVQIPRDQLVVITGLSGSGKSSLAFDTIYAEGQRRYVESLSAYARQFLQLMNKPDMDHIDGLSPAISIEQKTTSRNPRSTVGTVTEIYDYMRLLWARIGIPYSPATGLPIESQTISQMVDRIMDMEPGARLYLLAPVARGRKGEYRKEFADLMKRGFQRIKVDGELYELDQVPALEKNIKHDIAVVVDRVVLRDDLQARQGFLRQFEPQHRARLVDPEVAVDATCELGLAHRGLPEGEERAPVWRAHREEHVPAVVDRDRVVRLVLGIELVPRGPRHVVHYNLLSRAPRDKVEGRVLRPAVDPEHVGRLVERAVLVALELHVEAERTVFQRLLVAAHDLDLDEPEGRFVQV